MKLTEVTRRWFWAGLLVTGGGACALGVGMALQQPQRVAAALPPGPSPERSPGTPVPEAKVPGDVATSAPRAGQTFPDEFYREYPPSSRIPMRIPFVQEGIEVGPGLFVPPLNGVKVEDKIPAIGRNPRLPPPGPVVAKVISADGQEYWEHEDGSYTSCTYSRIRKPDGAEQEIVATQHGVAVRSQAPR